MSGNELLPEFKRPPVFETAMVVRLAPPGNVDITPLVADYWQKIRESFPTLQLAPPLELPVENLGSNERASLKLELFSGVPPHRWFMISEDNQDLLQIQGNSFGRNWRKLSADAEYPRYQHVLRASFEEQLGAYLSFLADKTVREEAPVVQCEMRYVNHIVAGKTWQKHADTRRIFTCCPEPSVPQYMGLEETSLTHRFLICDHGEPIGRLHLSIEPALRVSDRAPLYVMTLTARGAPLGAGVRGAMKFFDCARKSIVESFASLTTPAMHEEWERMR